MYSALDIASYIVEYSNDRGVPISNLKLQKILYFVQAEFLASKGVPCFYEDIEAWNFGPVIPEVYHKYKVYGSSNIPSPNVQRIITPSINDEKLIQSMVDACAGYSSTELVEITHKQTPWLKAYIPYYNNVISKASIHDYFVQ